MVPQIQTDQTGKVTINPAITAMRQSRRCHAKTKRTGLPCKAPAVTGYNVCRMHGAKGGAPSGTANGRYVHGSRTTKHKAMMAMIRYCVTTAKEC